MMTKEQALQIVEKASEVNEGLVNGDLTAMISSITGYQFKSWDGFRYHFYWYTWCEGTGTEDDLSNESVAEGLAYRINQVENLLFAVGRQPEPKEVVK